MDDTRERDPDLLRMRWDMEVRFLHSLRIELCVSSCPTNPDRSRTPSPRSSSSPWTGTLRASRSPRPGSRRMARAMRRCAAGPAAEHFHAEHVEADAVHEQVVRHEVIGGLLADEPAREAGVALGCAATDLLEDRLEAHLHRAWDQGRSALRTALPEP
ncbi:iron-containing redox enzyme family protein [Streptomyces sp. NPDC090741]|uniref:iron-containing redox enzyme family protein n=1 Tax=Streptomyces sp. NPDC090741 TaxID=3365967 RepID=UPI003819DB34